MNKFRLWIDRMTDKAESLPVILAPLAFIALVLLYLLSRIPKISRWLERKLSNEIDASI